MGGSVGGWIGMCRDGESIRDGGGEGFCIDKYLPIPTDIVKGWAATARRFGWRRGVSCAFRSSTCIGERPVRPKIFFYLDFCRPKKMGGHLHFLSFARLDVCLG